jgi:VWFA-related protein
MNIKPSLPLLLLFCILLPALGQNKPAPPPPPQQSGDQDDVVRINTSLVQVDVVVTKDGKPVTDLTADDFEIYEDGRRQTITNFAYISNVLTSAQPAPSTAKKNKDAVVPYAPVKPTDPRRIMAFVVDDLGVAWENMPLVKQQLRKFINEQMEPRDLVAIIRTGGQLGVLQQFTNDKRLLLRAVERLRWNSCNRVGHYTFAPVGTSDFGGSICGGRSYDLSLHALRFIIDSMGYLPGRKSLVLLSDSMPVESQENEGLGSGLLTSGTARDERLSLGSNLDFTHALQAVAEMAIRSSVVIYSVETAGLVYTGPTAADPFPLGQRQVWAGAQGPAENGPQQTTRLMLQRSDILWARRQGGDIIARQTGGFPIRNSNSYDFDRILKDQAGYYLLGYRPSEETFNRRFHRLKAKVKRSGMALRTRFGFFGVTEEEAKRAKPATRSVANLALASPFAAQDIEVDLTSFYADDTDRVPVVRSFVYVDPKDMTFTRTDGRYHASLELYGVIFGDNGTIVEQRADAATFNFSDADYEQIARDGIGIGFDMPAKRPGAYQVRVAVRDKASSKIGTAGQYMAVPDLKKQQQLAVSGIVLGTVNADKTVGRTGIRSFLAGSDLYYAYNLYNAIDESGNQRDLVMDVMLFREGKLVQTIPDVPIVATDQSDRTRVFVGNTLRLDPALEPGHYHLQVLVRNRNVKQKGPAVAQWADFAIEKK